MAFRKFSKGQQIYSVPNGIGDGSAYFGKTEAVLTDIDKLPYGNAARSISCWIYPTRYNGHNHVFFSYGSNSSNQRYGIACNTSGSAIDIYGHGNTTNYKYNLAINNWYHVVVTFDTDYIEKCYIDGVLIDTKTHRNINTVKNQAKCGRSASDSEQTDWFYGNITELKVYNRVITAAEVAILYGKGITDDKNKKPYLKGMLADESTSRVLYVPLRHGKDKATMFSTKSFVYDTALWETSSGFDLMGYPFVYTSAEAAAVNFVTIPTDSSMVLYMKLSEYSESPEVVNTNVFSATYKGNNLSDNYVIKDNVPCLYLNTTSSIRLTRVAAQTVRQCTVSYWGKYTNSSQCIVTSSLDGTGHYSGGAEFWLVFYANGAYFTSDNDKGTIINVTMPISADWHHIAVTWDMDTNYMYLYFDGKLIGECTDQSWLAPNFNVANFVLSVNNLYRASSIVYGDGYYSRVRMYSRALSAREVAALAKEKIVISQPDVPVVPDEPNVPDIPEDKQPLRFTAAQSNVSVTLGGNFSGDIFIDEHTYYRTSTNSQWTKYTADVGKVILANEGDYVEFYRDTDEAMEWNALGGKVVAFVSSSFMVSGDLQSMLNYSDTVPDSEFEGYFMADYSPHLVDASGLVLSATKLGTNCYNSMFSTQIELTYGPKELPATTLSYGCYYSMFSDCLLLREAPVIRALKLEAASCHTMFYYCESLSRIEVFFTTWHDNATDYWVEGAGRSGGSNKTFVKPTTLANVEGDSRIPIGWNVINNESGPSTPPVETGPSDCYTVAGAGEIYLNGDYVKAERMAYGEPVYYKVCQEYSAIAFIFFYNTKWRISLDAMDYGTDINFYYNDANMTAAGFEDFLVDGASRWYVSKTDSIIGEWDTVSEWIERPAPTVTAK